MSRVDRNNPIRSSASESRYTLFEFDREFPDDAACLEWLVRYRYPDGIYCPKCEKVTKHHREKKRPSYSCQFCGHRVHPMVGTIFEDSATSLRLWFYAIYLMASTRCGISAKQLERELGVTYKTAWRMFKQIRSLLTQDDEPMQGEVEVDETWVGGKPRAGEVRTKQEAGKWKDRKTPVFGMVERQGKVAAYVVPNSRQASVFPIVQQRVLPRSLVYSDDFPMYRGLRHRGYRHQSVNHSQKVYVMGDVHTNTIEGFFALLKSGIRGAYHAVSPKYLQTYLDEFAFRYNHRDAGERGMFSAFLGRLPTASSPETSL
ncbi:MAG TPA: IS1595 family transposase [Actinomycetota bacterium]|jgi:transposase-like protein|nr:IS1595 family transposase [Actinomycetota bacterium]